MAVIKSGKLVQDHWVFVPDDAELPSEGDIVVSLDRWRNAREALSARDGGLGIRLRSDQLADSLGQEAGQFQLIALDFPKFSDGRSYSTARLLRERYGFTGELRAVGNVLRDQFLFMDRCGFDAIEMAQEERGLAWEAALSEIKIFYQPAGDCRAPVTWQRHREIPEIRAG
jgi:uncharacterized protein (DUF934 family)